MRAPIAQRTEHRSSEAESSNNTNTPIRASPIPSPIGPDQKKTNHSSPISSSFISHCDYEEIIIMVIFRSQPV